MAITVEWNWWQRLAMIVTEMTHLTQTQIFYYSGPCKRASVSYMLLLLSCVCVRRRNYERLNFYVIISILRFVFLSLSKRFSCKNTQQMITKYQKNIEEVIWLALSSIWWIWRKKGGNFQKHHILRYRRSNCHHFYWKKFLLVFFYVYDIPKIC